MKSTRFQAAKRRHARVRRRIKGTTERPRLVIKRTSRHLYAQIFDDEKGVSLLQLSTTRKSFEAGKDRSNKDSAKKLGSEVGAAAKDKGVDKVVFDRGGFLYHGVVKEFAEAARAAGLQF